MIPPGFEYHVPRSLPDALRLLSDLGGDAKLLAGGHSLLPMMKLRFAQPAHLIDLNRIESLRGIREEGGEIVIGAMTVESALLNSPIIKAKLPLLAEAVRLIADPQVRNRGTIGGDIAHGDPGNDHPALALALDARLMIVGPGGQRSIKADNFFHGTYMTDLAENEILIEVRYPLPAVGSGHAYEKLKRKTGDFATAGAAVVIQVASGVVKDVRIGLTNLAPMAVRALEAEKSLIGKPVSEQNLRAAADQAMAICRPGDDLRGDAEYKTAMAGQMVRRALLKAAARAR